MDRNKFAEFCGTLGNYEFVLDLLLSNTPLADISRYLEQDKVITETVLSMYVDEGILLRKGSGYCLNVDAYRDDPGSEMYVISRWVSAQKMMDRYATIKCLLEEKFSMARVHTWVYNVGKDE